jgi:hypothetical protein
MGDQRHYSPSELLHAIATHPDEVASHILVCEACRYVFALVRRVSHVPSEEESEVILEALREWRVH